MSAFMNIQAQKLMAENRVPPTSKQSSAQSTPSLSLTAVPARPDVFPKAESTRNLKDSGSATPTTTTPPLRPQLHNSPVPPQPATKTSPHLPHSEVKQPSLRPVESAHSRSASASSRDSSDDDFVYILDSVKTTEEAVERIRAVQQPKERSFTTLLNGLPGSTSNLADLTDQVSSRGQKIRHCKMKGGLPATMEEFYESPRYTVSLTAAREAVFSDALSGFHSYVEREKAQREKLRALQQQHRHHQYQHNHSHHAALTSFSSAATEEWNAALAAAAPQQQQHQPSSSSDKEHITPASVAETGSIRADMPSFLPTIAAPEKKGSSISTNLSSGAPSTPLKPSSNVSPRGASPAAAAVAASSSPPAAESTPGAATSAHPTKVDEAASEHLSASDMFIVRSRDTEAMSPVSSPRVNPSGDDFGKPSLKEEKPLTDKMPALNEPTNIEGAQQHADPNAADTGTAAASTMLLPPSAAAAPATIPRTTSSTTSDPAQAAKLEEMQLQTLLQERIYQRARVPIVFRCRYSLEFAETLEEQKQRVQMRDRIMRHNEHLADPGGLSHAMRQRIRDRYADPNTVAPEWPYVWEQFERDIPRETLFIEDVPHHDAEDALAAIMSYLEYCYDRAQQNIKERSEKLLAPASGGSAEPEKGKDETRSAEAETKRSASPPPAPKAKNFFETFFSASSAVIKGAVATVRSSLPDFVGDPLLSVSGLDPALYHASLLFPTDPKARSEKIYTAVREVVLASQQSFMGFPYQLLCEQVGTERLGLALEALESNQDEEEEYAQAYPTVAADAGHNATQQQQNDEVKPSPQELKSASANVSVPIHICRADHSDAEVNGNASTASFCSSIPNSRVVRVYHSCPSPTLTTDNSANRRRRGHTAHVIDEWNISSSSSHASDVMCSPCSPSTPITVPATAAATTAPPAPSADKAAIRSEENNSRAKISLGAARSPPPQSIETRNSTPSAVSAPPTIAATGVSAEKLPKDKALQRRRRERRRHRCNQLPLLVGEPRPYEFAVFLNLVRTRVAAKVAKEERKEHQRQHRERMLRMVEQQREQWRSAPSSNVGSRCTSFASLDGVAKVHGGGAAASATASLEPIKAKSPFREDVEGSAYLLPTQPADATTVFAVVRTSPLSDLMGRPTMPPETRGMRICLCFDAVRNLPLVVVNKLFRLFTMPGVRGLTSSSEERSEAEPVGAKADNDDGIVVNEHETAALHTRPSATNSQDGKVDKGQKLKNSEKSLLMLIQVQFTLFTKEEVEVRWKWWKV